MPIKKAEWAKPYYVARIIGGREETLEGPSINNVLEQYKDELSGGYSDFWTEDVQNVRLEILDECGEWREVRLPTQGEKAHD